MPSLLEGTRRASYPPADSDSTDPFDLLASTEAPRIIVSATHRLNIFGFFANGDLAQLGEDPAAGNYGFWDQRAALEWTRKNIEYFGGNKNNIIVGGLSAGGYSAFFQLHYDTYLPASERIIKRAFFWSNSVGVQPNPVNSEVDTMQLQELLEHFDIPEGAPPAEKIRRLRNVPAEDFVATMPMMKVCPPSDVQCLGLVEDSLLAPYIPCEHRRLFYFFHYLEIHPRRFVHCAFT